MAPSGRYSDEKVIEDIRSFFQDPEHKIYQYGDVHECNPDVPYHRKQIEVLFENDYFHWVTHRNVDNLIDEGFLKLVERPPVKFVVRSDIRYYSQNIKNRVKLIQRYSHPDVTKGVGDIAELLFSYMFRLNNFNIIDENANEYNGKKWTKTEHDLDFIIERDSLAYGVEIKNTLPYMEKEEFDVKLEMCEYLELIPLWILRNAPAVQFWEMKAAGGFILKFKTQIYPPGQRSLVRDIWKLMALPVDIRKEIPNKIKNKFLWQHNRRI